MDDLEPKDLEGDDDLDGGLIDDDLSSGPKKSKKDKEGDEESFDDLAEEEGGILPEDSYDDVEPEDLW